VIRAHDVDLGRTVALKILPPDMAADPENINRFKQEARAAAKLDHENVARVYYCGEDQGLHFIAFEFVEGENLRVRMEKNGGLLGVADSLHYLIQVTAGLGHAASRSVVHRDIKPSNIIITPEGKAKIVDMGLARNMDARSADGQLTQSGVTLGTFDYISPEQAIEPRAADCRSDIYSLGCTFYHVMSGHLPVPEGTAAKKLHCHQHVAPIDPREWNPAIPDEMASILGKMMAKDPAQRYQHPDHLLQHLLIVAQKLNISTGAIGKDSGVKATPYNDQPLPSPPGLSPMWIGMAVVALAVGLFAISSGLGEKKSLDRSAPFWDRGQQPKEIAVGPVQPTQAAGNSDAPADPPAQRKGPQQARNADELIKLLQQRVKHITLESGITYDLTLANRKDPSLQAVFQGNELLLEYTKLSDPPTIKLAMAARDDGMTDRPGSLTIRGLADGSSSKVEIRGIRFEFVESAERDQTGISLLDVDQIEVYGCIFATPGKSPPQDGPAAFAVTQLKPRDTEAKLKFNRCYFAPGCVAVQITGNGGRQSVQATECAFGPQYAAFRVEGDAVEPLQIRLDKCSVLMSAGSMSSVVEIGDQVPCVIEAGGCLFSNPELPLTERCRAFVVSQRNAIAGKTRFGGQADEKMLPIPNGYHNVLAYGNDGRSYTFDDCKTEMVPVEDVTARMLTENPWKEQQPITRLFEEPDRFNEAFAVDLSQEVLRLEPDKNRNVLGTKHLPGPRPDVYTTFPFPPLNESKFAKNEKVWYPSYLGDDKSLPTNFYRDLQAAVKALKKGDTLLIKHTGDLPMSELQMATAEFESRDTDVTIKPERNSQFVLVPRVTDLKKDSALFKLYGGQVVFENLRFRLKPDRAPAIVALPGGGSCTFRNCSAELEEGDDLTVVSLADPRGEMMMGAMTPQRAPKIVVEDCFIRGRGRLAYVHGSRPFDLKVKNSLVVLDGSMIGVDPSSLDLSGSLPSVVNLERITTYLTKNLLFQKAMEKPKGPGLVQVQIHAAQCLFVAATDQTPLIQLDRIDTLELGDSVFIWKECKQNVYGFKLDQPLLSLQADSESNKPELLSREQWISKWKEPDAAFDEVKFKVKPPSRYYDKVYSSDFIPNLKEGMSEVGPSLEMLRKKW